MAQSQAANSPLSTLSRIGRTAHLCTREKLQLLSELRREATLMPSPRVQLGFDASDVDAEIDQLRRRVLRGIGPRVEQDRAGL